MHYARLIATLALIAKVNAIPQPLNGERDDNAAYRPSVTTYTTDAEDIDKREAAAAQPTDGTLIQLDGKNAGIPVSPVSMNTLSSQTSASSIGAPSSPDAKVDAPPTQPDGHVFAAVGNMAKSKRQKPQGQGEIGKKPKGSGSGSGKVKKQGGGQPKSPGSGGAPKPPKSAGSGQQKSKQPSGAQPGSKAPASSGAPAPSGGSPAPSGSPNGGQTKKSKGKGKGSGSGQGGLPKQQQGNKVGSGTPAIPSASSSGTPSSSGGDTFNIQVENSCPDQKTVGIFGVTSSFQATQNSPIKPVAPGGTVTLPAPFHGIGLRLTANADQGPNNVFQAQSLFEFGFSSFQGQDGTSYDLSLMQGAQIGMAVQVLDNGNGSGSCESKSCATPQNCPASQGWTNPDQINLGSPADTTCYKGKTDFKVTLCPAG